MGPPTNPPEALFSAWTKAKGYGCGHLTERSSRIFLIPGESPATLIVNYGFQPWRRSKRVDIVAVNLRKVTYQEQDSKVAVLRSIPNWTSGADLLTTLC